MTEPEVSVPAVMRNYHEVLRNDLAKVLTPLADAGDVAGFAGAWRGYVDAIAAQWAQLLPTVRSAAGPAIWAAVVAEVPSLQAA